VYQPTFVQPTQRSREGDRDAEEHPQFHRAPQQTLERLTAPVSQEQDRAATRADEVEGPQGPCVVQIAAHFEFMGETMQARARRVLCREHDSQHRSPVSLRGAPLAAADDPVVVLAQNLNPVVFTAFEPGSEVHPRGRR
jgi:hypothetical protein